MHGFQVHPAPSVPTASELTRLLHKQSLHTSLHTSFTYTVLMTQRGVCRCLQDNLKADNFTQSCKAEVQRYEQTASTDYRSAHCLICCPYAGREHLRRIVLHLKFIPVTHSEAMFMSLGEHCPGHLQLAPTWYTT